MRQFEGCPDWYVDMKQRNAAAQQRLMIGNRHAPALSYKGQAETTSIFAQHAEFECRVRDRALELSKGQPAAYNLEPLKALVRHAYSMGYEIVPIAPTPAASAQEQHPQAPPDLPR